MAGQQQIRPVWRHNLRDEMALMSYAARDYPFAAIDVEFPGFLSITPRHATDAVRYNDMRRNVDATKIIQLGITLFDHFGNVPAHGSTWEINFSDFDAATDAASENSIQFLRNHGFDFDRCRRDGVPSADLASLILSSNLLGNLHFVFFHGLYDIGYLLKILTRGAALPESPVDFWKECTQRLGAMFDVKYMARFFEGLEGGEMGLAATAAALGMGRRLGLAHHAGSDSLSTAAAFAKMVQLGVDLSVCQGFFYGIEKLFVQ